MIILNMVLVTNLKLCKLRVLLSDDFILVKLGGNEKLWQVSDRNVRTERTQAESSGKLHERAKVLFDLRGDITSDIEAVYSLHWLS